MITYTFTEKNGSGSLIFNADNYEDALEYLKYTVINPAAWRYEDEEPTYYDGEK